MLTEQLNGAMDLHTDGKTEIRITFPPKREDNDAQLLESPS
jgi:hypothetical protein